MNRFHAELRAEVNGDRLSGHAAVFGAHARIRNHWETLSRTAFDAVLDTCDCRALINHDPSKLLARTGAGTLKLSTDESGLYFEVPQLPKTSYADDLRESIDRGDLDGCSFGFVPGEDSWGTAPDGSQLQTHTSIGELFDVSCVTYPAYAETEVVLRHVDFTVPSLDRRSQLIRARFRARLTAPGGAAT